MPLPNIKGLKGLGRRKSAGNSIDDGTLVAATGSSSFRVIPRDEATRKSVGGPISLDGRKDYLPARQNSDEEFSSSNRGSGSTASTAHSRTFDSVSNTRFSSSSTLQSPVEAIKKDTQFTSHRSQSPSYLNLSADIDNSDDFGDMFAGFNNRKSRLLEDDLLLSKPPAPAVLRTESEPLTGNPSRSPFSSRANKTPPPLNFGKSRDVPAADKSPYSWNSNDGLMSSPTLDDSPVPDEPPPVPQHKSGIAETADGFTPIDTSAGSLRPPIIHRSMSQESFTPSGTKGDTDAQMVSASVRAVRASTLRSTGDGSPSSRTEKIKQDSLAMTSGSSSSGNSLHTPSMTSSASSVHTHESPKAQRTNQNTTPTPLGRPLPGPASNNTTPRAKRAELSDDEEPLTLDMSIVSAINIDGRDSLPSQAAPRPPEVKKVYTAKQFEILKKHAEKGPNGKSVDSDSEGEYEDDEDDEAMVLQKKRIQQEKEAQHLIWRQKMTKAIGDQSSPLPGRPSFQRVNHSTPNLSFGHASKNSISDNGGSGGSSDDEDVPLGILQAHGFPKKDQSPDPRLSSHSFVGTSGALPQRPASPARSTTGGNRNGVLPPFARKLPTDPYMGQGDLVNPANRESMGFNKAPAAQPVHMPTGVPPPMPQMPGGLVGVIAEEERQRGMRRGSPNAQARQSTMLPPGIGPMGPLPQMMPGMGAMGMGTGIMPIMPSPVVSPEQLQLNQQMFQLMQQQAAMIEQMSWQMSQLGQAPNTPQSSFLQPPNAQNRRMSMASNPRSGYPQSRTMSMVNVQPPSSFNQRTMSMVNPPPDGWMQTNLMSSTASIRGLGLQNAGYAPSVAPSERSNIGQPSRYKPVQSSHLADGGSTITAGSTVQPTPIIEKKRSSFFSAIIHPPHKGKGKEGNIAEEEEEDWGAFAKNRRKART